MKKQVLLVLCLVLIVSALAIPTLATTNPGSHKHHYVYIACGEPRVCSVPGCHATTETVVPHQIIKATCCGYDYCKRMECDYQTNKTNPKNHINVIKLSEIQLKSGAKRIKYQCLGCQKIESRIVSEK